MSDASVQDAAAPEAVAPAQEAVAAAPEAVAAAPEAVAPVPEAVAPVPEAVAAAPVEVAAAPEAVAPVPEAVAPVPEAVAAAVAAEVVPEDATSPMARLNQELSSLNLFEGNTQKQIMGIRQQVENGLQAFNAIQNACQIIHDAVVSIVPVVPIVSIVNTSLRFNPEIGHLSDFVDHCKLLISINDSNADGVAHSVSAKLKALAEDAQLKNSSYRLTVDQANIGNIGVQNSLVLRIGEVFNVPVFTVYVLQNVFDNKKFDSEKATQNILALPLKHNLKTIATCSRVDLMLELLLHATKSEPYEEVNPLISHSINELVVSKFDSESSPNKVIQQVRDQFFGLLLPSNELAKSLIVKAILIAIIQNPLVKTSDGKRFFDMFPSGQYVKYLGEIAYKATIDPRNQGPIMLPNEMASVNAMVDEVGEAPGFDEPVPPREQPSHPMTRTDIIVAAFTAANDAMGSSANIVAAGGAAVSYYIADFMKGINADEFRGVIPESGLDGIALEALKKNCENIPMNDIDCFVFGKVSRKFLLLFSLYMMILHANFYERPKRYGVQKPFDNIGSKFILLPQSSESSDNIELFMYGNNNSDANTRLISKRLKKNPNVQLVTQETKCFSQLSSMVCGERNDMCSVDSYFTQPIDLVKKEVDDFLILYESLYPDDHDQPRPNLKQLLVSQYMSNVDNMVSMKTTMLDLVCIFCNEDKALFIRIFMARKNPKDFSRLRVFIEIYLLELLRANDSIFQEHKVELLREITELRVMMTALNEKYYLEQGNIAAVRAETAKDLNANRAAFLNLLRSIGRKIVLIPDPLNDTVPARFRKQTGKNTLEFFKDRQNAQQIKYPFKMDQHMFNLYSAYMSDSNYDAWLNGVFEEIRFEPVMERMFRDKMSKITSNPTDSLYFEVGFDDMLIKSEQMLKLLSLLRDVKGSDDMFKQGRQGQLKRDFTKMLLGPLKTSINRSGGIEPKASGVFKLYGSNLPKATLRDFVKKILSLDDLPNIESIINDDAGKEEIGRILLEWNRNTSVSKGGATRKRKRACKRNAHTRRMNKCFQRATRKKTHAGKDRHKRTRRT